MESRVYPGLGFRPTDEELVGFYLKHKLLSDDPRVHVIPVIDLCQVDPWQVPVRLAESAIQFNDPAWFFFSPVDFKYSNSKRFNRTTKCGYWKTTGKERDIRSLDANTVIGTKKTLVFYEGRVPRGVRSNWVIHEYHDATFHQSQRTFVLCRLMKKPEKTTDGGTDALFYDEGEPSGGTVSDFENQGGNFTGMETISQATYQAEKYFSPTQQSPTGAEMGEPSFPNYPFYDAYFRNENNIMQAPFKITEEDEFLNSILVDDSLAIDEESMHASFNNFTQSESLKMVYCESSDTDTEIVSKLDGFYMDTSAMCNEYPNSDEYYP